MLVARKAGIIADSRNREPCSRKELLGFLNANAQQIVHDGFAGCFTKQLAQSGRGIMKPLRDGAHRKLLRVFRAENFQCLLDYFLFLFHMGLPVIKIKSAAEVGQAEAALRQAQGPLSG